MNRRELIKSSASLAAGSAVFGQIGHIMLPVSGHGQAVKSRLAVVSGTDYSKLPGMAIDALGGIKTFVREGFRVVVKPNMGWNRTPDLAANTHPEIVQSIVKLALEAGARSVSVFDRTCNEERLCYNRSGIKPSIDSLKNPRATCDFIDNRKFVETEITNGKSIQRWDFYKDVLDADLYINVPVAKQHGLTKLSLGLKNVMGIIGGSRGKIHHAIGQRVADLNLVVRPSLTIVDATRMLLRNGPAGGNLKDVKINNMLVASTDIVAADAFVSTLFGYQPEDLDTTVAAWKAGLGEMNLDKVDIVRV
jgi:uncharacterized protein (DUF362 family)